MSLSLMNRDIVFLMLQFLHEESCKETLHTLEKESRLFFNLRYFEDIAINGELDEVEKYLSGFTKLDDNRYSRKMFFLIRRHKYLEALDRGYKARAVGILTKELKVFSAYDEEIVKKLAMLLTLGNFRENEQLSRYGDTKSARKVMLDGLKKLIQENPLFRDKLQFPSLNNSRLRKLMMQSLTWQHLHCSSPRPNPEIQTLFVDHSCGSPNYDHAPSPVTNPLMGSVPPNYDHVPSVTNPLMGSVTKVGGFPPQGAHGLYPLPASQMALLSRGMANKSSITHQTIATRPIIPTGPSNVDSENVEKRSRPFGISRQINYPPVDNLQATYPAQSPFHTLSASNSNPGASGVVANGRERRVPLIGRFNYPPVDNLRATYPAQSPFRTLSTSNSNPGISGVVADGGEQMVPLIGPFNYPPVDNLQTTYPAHSPFHKLSASNSNPGISGVVADGGEQIVPLIGPVGDTRGLPQVKPIVINKSDKSKIWKLTEINEPSQLHSLRLPDSLLPLRVVRLMYTHSGCEILALAQNAMHKVWKWQKNERNLVGKATSRAPPEFRLPSNGILMTNDVHNINKENVLPCFVLSKNDVYLLSASGGMVSLFIMEKFKLMATLCRPPPAATFLALDPNDNKIIAVGMDDSSIHIYNISVNEVLGLKLHLILNNHQKRVTGLAFSFVLNVLVSSGADAQLCVWSMDGWEILSNKFLKIPKGSVPTAIAQTHVQFHPDQIHVLAVHETQIAIYKAPTLECLKQWFPLKSIGAIMDATYSSDGQSIYAAFKDGSVGVLTARTLQLTCRISPSAYLASNPCSRTYPVVVAAHPFQRHQFALGLSDGRVLVIEPLESEGTWGTPPPVENVAKPSISSEAGLDQQQR